jgi:hypothetical protein
MWPIILLQKPVSVIYLVFVKLLKSFFEHPNVRVCKLELI